MSTEQFPPGLPPGPGEPGGRPGDVPPASAGTPAGPGASPTGPGSTHGGPGGPHGGPHTEPGSTHPGAGGPAGSPPSGADGFFQGVRRLGLHRSTDRWVGGVAGGLAARLGVDPLLVRGVFFVTALVTGLGLLVYAVAWALLPEESDGRIHLQQAGQGKFDIALVGAATVLVLGLGWGGRDVGGLNAIGLGWINGLLWLALAAGVVAVVVAASRRSRPGSPPGGTPGGPPSPADAAGTAPGADETAWSGETPWSAGGTTWSAATPTWAREGTTWTASGTSGASTPPPPTPPVAPAPQEPRVHGPGAVATGIVAALGLLTFGGLLAARRLDLFDGPVVLTALGVVVVIAGLVTAVSGLRGRSSGGVGGMAVLAVLAGVPLALWSGTGVSLSDASTSFAGNATFVPDSATEAGHGYALIAGEWTIDLREVPLDGGTLTVPVTMAAGQLTVIVPPEAAVDATVRLAAGEAAIELDGERSTADGLFLRPLQREDTDAASGDDPDLVLDIHGAAGQVLVTEKG